jgi:DNA-binding transcriptional LysR family regulator
VHINDLDLNLLRVFDAVYSARSVSRAADRLGLTQPAASQALMRLRLLLGDALFVRAAGGVAPTPRAERLAVAVQQALGTLEQALQEASQFDPAESHATFRLHLSDIGEARFLPPLMAALREQAPGVRLEAAPLPHADITPALDTGKIDFALGFLPSVVDTQRTPLLADRYIILVRSGHPMLTRGAAEPVSIDQLRTLDFVAVASHAQTLRLLQTLGLNDRLRLTAAHFLALPAIVRETDLGAMMPRNIATGFVKDGGHAIVELDMQALPERDFTVSLHWSRRFEATASHRWMRQLLVALFADNGSDGP